MDAHLVEKTRKYETLLAEALDDTAVRRTGDAQSKKLAQEHIEMAEAYLDDGRHFMEDDDCVNALASFSYGHGWLDAAIRSDLVESPEDDHRNPRSV